MKTFTDANGREWALSIDVAAIKRMRDIAGVDILGNSGSDNSAFLQMAENPVMLVDAIYAVCKKEVEARGMDQDAFAVGITGDVIDRATSALLDAVIDFFPSARRNVLKAAIEKLRALQGVMLDHALASLSAAMIPDSGKPSTN
jgi:hypothetical protein